MKAVDEEISWAFCAQKIRTRYSSFRVKKSLQLYGVPYKLVRIKTSKYFSAFRSGPNEGRNQDGCCPLPIPNIKVRAVWHPGLMGRWADPFFGISIGIFAFYLSERDNPRPTGHSFTELS